MKKIKFKYLYIFWPTVSLLFILAVSTTILLASGYRFNLKNMHLEKTGSIKISTIPTKANLYLDNKIIATRSPFSISYLLPGKYDIKIEASDRKIVEKKISVEAAKVTYNDSIILWKENIQVKPYSKNDDNLFSKSNDLTIKETELYDNGKFITRTSDIIIAAEKLNKYYLIATENTIYALYQDGSCYVELIKSDTKIKDIRYINTNHTVVWSDEAEKVYSAELY